MIEHNLDFIKNADFIVDLGPCAGEGGGEIIFSGPPEEIVKCKESKTGLYLEPVQNLSPSSETARLSSKV